MKNKKIKKRIHFKPFKLLKKLSFFEIVILISIILAVTILTHDFIFWAVMPLFTGNFYCLTYTGLFVDIFCIFVLEAGTQYFKEIL